MVHISLQNIFFFQFNSVKSWSQNIFFFQFNSVKSWSHFLTLFGVWTYLFKSEYTSFEPLFKITVPKGSHSHGGVAAFHVIDINQPSLPTPFYCVFASVSVFMALSTLFHSINSPNNTLLFHSVLPVLLPLIGPFNYILCGWLGLKHQLTN